MSANNNRNNRMWLYVGVYKLGIYLSNLSTIAGLN